MKEMVIVSDVRHPIAMANATMYYARAVTPNFKFLFAKNEHMAKKLQATKKKVEQSAGSSMENMRKTILAEVSMLEATMRK